MRFLFTAIILCLVLSAGCRHDGNDPRLVRIAELTETSPRQALEALDSINPAELTDGDRHFFDLLTIKAKDKEYITHTSDSLILDVISYYDRHRDNPYYPEALYYGGRVYSDLGDYPSALSFFRTAIDILPPDRKNNSLRARLLSQTSSLLNSLRLYDKALPYAEEAIRIDSIETDTLSLLYDHQLLGLILLRSKQYDHAEIIFNKSRYFAKSADESELPTLDIYSSAIKYYKGEIDSALYFIRESINDVEPYYYNYAFSIASKIYKAANLPDSAIIYSKRLLGQKDLLNKQNAYQQLLSPELIKYLPQDSIAIFVSDFRDVVENYLNQYGKQETLIQNSIYNYQTHVRQRENAQKSSEYLKKIVIAFVCIAVILIIGILFIKNKNKNNIIRLQQALNNINTLKKQLDSVQNETPSEKIGSKDCDGEQVSPETKVALEKPTQENLRERLSSELLSIYKSSPEPPPVPEKIVQSEIYRKLQRKIRLSEDIKTHEEDKIWGDLRRVVLDVSPNFISNLG